MRFNLSFNGWPPLASHLGVFFLGAIVMSQARSVPTVEKVRLKTREVLIRPAPRFLALAARVKPSELGFSMVIRTRDKLICRLNQHPLKVLQLADNAVISIAEEGEQQLVLILQTIKKQKEVELKSFREVSTMKQCTQRKRVEYGS